MGEEGKTKKVSFGELAGRAYERELAKALADLDLHFEGWRRKSLNSFDLSERIHEFHDKTARDLWKKYHFQKPQMAVAWAVADGVLEESEIPPGRLAVIKKTVDTLRELRRLDAEAEPGEDIGESVAVPAAEAVLRREPGEFKCPACGRFVYNRRLKDCEFCGNRLPAEMVYTDEEMRRINAEIQGEIAHQRLESKLDKAKIRREVR